MQLLLQDLDGETLAGHLLIGRQVHHAHTALTELALDAVAAAEQLTDRQPHRVGGAVRLRLPGCAAVSISGPYIGRPRLRRDLLRARGQLRIDFSLAG